jgi:inward rectifier potassium channel
MSAPRPVVTSGVSSTSNELNMPISNLKRPVVNAAGSHSGSNSRLISEAHLTAKIIPRRREIVSDFYHSLLNLRWPALVGLIGVYYVVANLFFAACYTVAPDGVKGSTGFIDNFFFSVQTWATIGYGNMSPATMTANVLVVVESMTSIISVALLAGLMFAKFSRPPQKILFADAAVVSRLEGKPTLMIRVVNQRHSVIANASAKLTMLGPGGSRDSDETHDLQLACNTVPFLRRSWTLKHVMDQSSPLAALYDPKGHGAADVQIVVTIFGYDASLGQTAFANFGYDHTSIRFNHHYVPCINDVDGRMTVEHEKFPVTESESVAEGEGTDDGADDGAEAAADAAVPAAPSRT